MLSVGLDLIYSIAYCIIVEIHNCFTFYCIDRMHAIDSLPLVWMLDGRIVTCEYLSIQVLHIAGAMVDICQTLTKGNLHVLVFIEKMHFV